jgi:hypothetical protein
LFFRNKKLKVDAKVFLPYHFLNRAAVAVVKIQVFTLEAE